ncbi:VanW family protein, partial [Patescibacteria group bacterium]|nr:VanW family protein [Patescibacteria group bacterium]
MKLLAKLKLNGYFENKRVLKSLLLALGAMSIVFGGCALACFFYIRSYENRIYPNIVVAGMEIGGLTQKEATDLLQAQYNGMLEEGISIASPLGEDGLTAVENIDLRLIGATDPDLVRDIIVFNPDMLALQAYQIGRTEHPAINTIKAMLQLVYKRELDSSITMDSETLESEIKNVFESYEQPGSYTDYVVNFARNEINVDAVQGSIGLVLDTTSAIEEITQDMQDFYIETIQLKLVQTQNPVSEQEASTLVDEVKNIITNATYTLEFTSEDLKEYSWDIEKEQIADWILPWKNDDGNIELIVEEDKIESFFGEIHSDIDENPTNARFIIEDGKVVEFAGSLDGIELDETKTMEKILQEIHQQTLEPIKIVVSVVEPSITTGSVNNFGIKEILGVGTSDFSGSPYNRIQNIKHGASKLNGLLIAPGETISLVEHLRPFTTADGYLPELVIKGDEIKAEIGGGLCQIGTTAFRAVMNSGLEVTERRNHSLVVSYYDDSTNGNPGTDATIYD